MSKKRVIAFYLPQFFPTPENDEWWGPGFTEWTNVARCRPLFKGHYQPRIPADLGFYDLRLPETRAKQAELAEEAGIEGFCYWHYWFAGRRLLDRVFREVVESGAPDFPFCLCWANHSWYSKTWDSDVPDKLLIEQTYPGVDDFKNHFYAMLPAFKDPRYIKIDGRLVFGIYDIIHLGDPTVFFDTWNDLAKENGFEGFYFFGLVQTQERKQKAHELGYENIVYDCLQESYNNAGSSFVRKLRNIRRKLFKYPNTVDYKQYVDRAVEYYQSNTDIIPCIEPGFDHAPRSGYRWLIMDQATPEEWGRLCQSVVNSMDKNKQEILFIKAWNEWAEGNYLEPDMKYGHAFINKLKDALK